jgi:RimJ/RimL family protein N-acetyltransferase
MEWKIEKLSPREWAQLSEDAHKVVFGKMRPAEIDRIDYALLVKCDGEMCGYMTVRELDNESAYWQFGGAFPGTRDSAKSVYAYREFVKFAEIQYKRVTTLVENSNIAYLKLAMASGFRIIGTRFFKGTLLVELLLDFTSSPGEGEQNV